MMEEEITGTLFRKRSNVGSKSEAMAVWMKAADREFILVRAEGPSFGDDPVLQALVGKKVSARGRFVHPYFFKASLVKEKHA